jgi:hypothetical protein
VVVELLHSLKKSAHSASDATGHTPAQLFGNN